MVGKSIRIRLSFCKVNGKTLYSLLTGSCRQTLDFLPTENVFLVIF